MSFGANPRASLVRTLISFFVLYVSCGSHWPLKVDHLPCVWFSHLLLIKKGKVFYDHNDPIL